MKLQLQSWLGAAALLALAVPATLDACTGVTLTAENGDVVYGRTMEWGSFNVDSRLMAYPRSFHYQSRMPEGRQGLVWDGRYGIAGIDIFESGCLADGMNEVGLTAGMFYQPGFAEYAAWTPENAARALPPSDLANYILSTCATVEEAQKAISGITVVDAVEAALGITPPLHLMITEPNGKQIIVEWNGGKAKFYTSEVGVITNSPNYDWHLTNLRNYLNLTSRPHDPVELGKLKLFPLGGGSSMLGMPGDFTPPSRFVRAVALRQVARPLPDGNEAIYEMFQILDNFDVPLGLSEGEGDGPRFPKGLRSATAWTIAHDQAHRKFYYHTQNDRQVQMLDMNRIDFTKLKQPIVLPLDDGVQAIKDRTPEALAE